MSKDVQDVQEVQESELFNGEPVIEFSKQVDRRNFLKYAGIIGVGSTLALAGCSSGSDEEESPKATSSPSKKQNADTDVLNYALTLEYLEAEFYTKGLEGGILSGREKDLIEPIKDHEDAHVDALKATIEKLGDTPVEKPTFKFPTGTFTDKATFLKTAVTFEELGVGAYHGQVKEIENVEILGAAASIAGVESRHAAILQVLTGGNPFPAPSEKATPKAEVLSAATPFIAS